VVNGKTLDVSYISAMDDLEQGSYEILEPKKAAFRRCEPSEPDVVIVPAIAFDPSGHRIGYGAGFYDRLLPQTNAVKIGIGYSFCMVESAFPEAHDVPADYVITD
jgi:5-formyltetrahydrofolate cyclo-ligase